jgi:sporulation protein YlmC with PRC-barrel domain
MRVHMAYNRCMYALASKIILLPVLSLQTGANVATIKGLVLDYANLEVVAFSCVIAKHSGPDIALMLRDVRELALDCVIVDSEDELTELDDIVRLKSLRSQGFTLIGKLVVSDMGRRLGNVEDYTINIETNKVQKLYVKQSIVRSFFGSSLIIDRAQIVDVSLKQIVVREATLKAGGLSPDIVPDINP